MWGHHIISTILKILRFIAVLSGIGWLWGTLGRKRRDASSDVSRFFCLSAAFGTVLAGPSVLRFKLRFCCRGAVSATRQSLLGGSDRALCGRSVVRCPRQPLMICVSRREERTLHPAVAALSLALKRSQLRFAQGDLGSMQAVFAPTPHQSSPAHPERRTQGRYRPGCERRHGTGLDCGIAVAAECRGDRSSHARVGCFCEIAFLATGVPRAPVWRWLPAEGAGWSADRDAFDPRQDGREHMI